MNMQGKKIGIWGFGKTGQAVLEYVAPLTSTITIFEVDSLSPEQTFLLDHYKAQLIPKNCLEQFLELNDIIIPSPGINLKPYLEYWGSKFISELDIFAQNIRIKTIAITGSVGKTTVVTLLTELLNRCGIKACAAGNIGLPMLSILSQQDSFDVIVLELSSFQLEQSKTFKPTLSAITNIFPNHLDRHETMADYLKAKSMIFAHQDSPDQTIIPQAFLEDFIHFTTHQKMLWLADDAYADFITPELQKITFSANWNLLFAILECFSIEPETVLSKCKDLKGLEHRFEFIGNYKGIDFYNDSKATIAESTLESIKKAGSNSLILFLGGLSKGVDRTELIQNLPKNIKYVLCFGKEAELLSKLCNQFNLPNNHFSTLESAWDVCTEIMRTGDTVLFSPAGTSYDLFKDYEQRGTAFKNLVKKHYKNIKTL